jgi:hypothetical protein
MMKFFSLIITRTQRCDSCLHIATLMPHDIVQWGSRLGDPRGNPSIPIRFYYRLRELNFLFPVLPVKTGLPQLPALTRLPATRVLRRFSCRCHTR